LARNVGLDFFRDFGVSPELDSGSVLRSLSQSPLEPDLQPAPTPVSCGKHMDVLVEQRCDVTHCWK